MPSFRFFQPIQLRYSDIDAQGHVNNARYITFTEYARFRYLKEVGLWDGRSFMDLDLIVADTHISYLAPIKLSQHIRVGTRVSKIGTKSMLFEFQIEDEDNGKIMATGETVMVCYDYHTETTKRVMDEWRNKISLYDGVIPK
jgi:acyl-CoA thioester hydrolase